MVLFFTVKAIIDPYIINRFRITLNKINALGLFQVRYFFAQKCKCYFIRAHPVLFEHKHSNRTEEFKVSFTPKKVFILENGKYKEITYREFLKLKSNPIAFGDRKFIGIHGMIFEAEEKLYREFYSYNRRVMYVEKAAKEENIKILSYDALSPEKLDSEAFLVDIESDFIEDVELKIMSEQLHRYIDMLTPQEKELVQAIYFQGLTERDFAEIEGVTQNAIHKRKTRILAKLKKFLKN